MESGEREIGRERLQEGEEGESEREKGGRVRESAGEQTGLFILFSSSPSYMSTPASSVSGGTLPDSEQDL